MRTDKGIPCTHSQRYFGIGVTTGRKGRTRLSNPVLELETRGSMIMASGYVEAQPLPGNTTQIFQTMRQRCWHYAFIGLA
jgi:hypothetical protein